MSKRKTRTKLRYGADAHYWREEMKPLFVAAALVQLVADRRQVAGQKLAQAVDAWKHPGCQSVLQEDILLPTVELVTFLMSGKKGHVHVPDLDCIDELEAKYKRNPDVLNMYRTVNEFIEVGFNRSRARRVVAESAPWLQAATMLWTAGRYMELHPNVDGEKELKLGDRVLDRKSFTEGVPSERLHRRRASVLKHFGHRLTQDKKIVNMARLWYLCRVRYSGPKECAAKLQEYGEKWTPENLSREVLLGDSVTGYPRRKPRKTGTS